MANDNPLMFPAREIPIVGMPFEVHGLITNVVISCKCEKKGNVVVGGAGPAIGNGSMCPSCGKSYFIAEMHYNVQTRQLQLQIGYDVSTMFKNQEAEKK